MCPGSGFHGSSSDGISPPHPYYSRDYRSTSHVVQIMYRLINNSTIYPTYPPRTIVWVRFGRHISSAPAVSLEPTAVRIIWPNESLRRILCRKNYVQVLYSLTNNSKIHPKLTNPPNRMGRIWTVYLLCTRVTLETTALQVKSAPGLFTEWSAFTTVYTSHFAQ